MPTAREVATKLRSLADHFESLGEKEIIKPSLQLNCIGSRKDVFLDAVSVMPRPLTKDYGSDDDEHAFIRVTHDSDAVQVQAIAMRSTVCRLIKPARPRWECEPLLLKEEEAGLAAD